MQTNQQSNILKSSWLDSPLGRILAIASETSLYLLEFEDCRGLERAIHLLQAQTADPIIPGTTKVIQSIQQELHAYFAGQLQEFKTPLHISGSPFQRRVWEALCLIPYGETRSYAEQAKSIDKPSAYRAVANANGANQIAILIPCHRIICSNGGLGGYAAGVARKKWLIEHESRVLS